MEIKYCENPAVGRCAPKCSESCCCFGGCNKKAYFEHIDEKHNMKNDYDKFPHAEFSDDNKDIHVVVDGRKYSNEEVLEILKKHKEEEDKKYHKCERCGARYLENNTFDMVTHNLDKKPDNCSAWGYAVTPYITGFKVTSTCGDGREIPLCDDCIFELKKWLTKPTESENKAYGKHWNIE